MGIGIITNFNVNAPKNIDARLGPYASVDQATGSIDSEFRYVGMTVVITGSGLPVDYWFNPTTANTDLVEKTTGGVTGGTIEYVAVWSGSTSLTTGSIYNNITANRVGINNPNPGYELDVTGDFRVTGSTGYIYQQNNKYGVVPLTSIASGSSVVVISSTYPEYYTGLFFDYQIEVYDGGSRRASRSGTLKVNMLSNVIQTNENTTEEYQIVTDNSIADSTENITLTVTDDAGGIVLTCNNLIDVYPPYTATIRGQWKLLSYT